MMKKLLAIILVLGMLFATIPAFAADNPERINSVDKSIVGKAANALTVGAGLDGMKYLSLGDSIEFGYGLNDDPYESKGLQNIINSYPDLIHEYLKENYNCTDEDFFQGAVCGARVVDLCKFLNNDEYPEDYFHQNFIDTYLSDEVQGSDARNYERYNNYLVKMKAAVKDADFITITAGGNDTMSFMLSALFDPGKYVKADDLALFYGKTAVAAYEAMKKVMLANAKLIDSVKGSEGTTKSKLQSLLGILDVMLYSIGGYVKGETGILDLIHEVNPDAVISITGLPALLNGYTFIVSEDGKASVDLGDFFTPMVKALNDVVKNAAEERSSYVRYVDIYTADTLPLFNYRLATDADKEYVKKEYGQDAVTDYAPMDDSYYPGYDKKYTAYTKQIPYNYVYDFIYVNGLRVTHPSEAGHKYIADEIMKNFKFQKFGGKLVTVKNTVANLWKTLMSKLGISKVANLLTTVKSLDIKSFVSSVSGFVKLLGIFYQ